MSEEIASARADLALVTRLHADNAELRRALEVAMQENDNWRAVAEQLNQRNHEAWMLVGQCDYFLQTMDSQPATARRQMAKKLRGRIKDATKAPIEKVSNQ